MELIALLILMPVSNLCQLTGPKKVSGELGRSITVNCQYDRKYEDNVKLWCKGSYYIGSSVVVSTEHPEKGKVTLTDNKTQGIFSVTMDKLIKSDGGRYWCVIETRLFKYNKMVSVDIELSEGQPQRSTMSPSTVTTESNKTPVTTALTTSTTANFHNEGPWGVILPVVLALFILLVIAAVILYVKLRQQKKNVTTGQNLSGVENSVAVRQEDTEVAYATVNVVPRPDLENTYLNLQEAQRTAKGRDSSETVEYSTLHFGSQ
ncbi:CMRF35-like molecule 1 [Scyliorhinus canicula]|uniref:CMRF35-like molecule 1 n=1 Tax=Scyliorhinus canicula TaxID=7830 RepID=UPI0018F4FB96|nr:CMRF35-like molecule 1 [Scyliorhinus canicula]